METIIIIIGYILIAVGVYNLWTSKWDKSKFENMWLAFFWPVTGFWYIVHRLLHRKDGQD